MRLAGMSIQKRRIVRHRKRALMRGLVVESLEPRQLLDSTTVFNELMYDLQGDEQDTEWVELYNQLAIRMDLSDWSLSGGIDYQFPEGTTIEPGGFLVVAADPSQLPNIDALGPFTGRLSNEGERIELRNNSQRLMSVVEYEVDGEWPVAANGSGASLAKRDERLAVQPAANWRASQQLGGTPGAPNFPADLAPPKVRFHEIAGAGTDELFIELINTGSVPVDLGTLGISTRDGFSHRLSAGQLPPGELAVIRAAVVSAAVDAGEPVFLTTTNGLVLDGQQATTLSYGWHEASAKWLRSESATPATANRFRLHDEIVINEIMYHAAPQLTDYQENSLEWIELYNRSDRAVDLMDWSFADAVEFPFPAATTIAAGNTLVITNDVAQFRATYPQVTNVIGDYRGSLSNRGETIRLLDQHGNPADEVAYYDGGDWDWRADGHGPSLELTDPRADNSVGLAWRASDESSRSQWNTYTYRGTAGRTIPGEPTVWRELLLGFLDGAGEAYLDDISVVEDPDGAALQLIQNGSFDLGIQHFRLLGNHQSSSVIDLDGNRVLHLISDGATEYQGNQLETTFVENRRLPSGMEYEVSFRAKWLSGSRQINSRFYFNQMPRTTVLDIPPEPGTPGRINSTRQANVGPTLDQLRHSPPIPAPGEPISFSVRAADPDGVAQVVLQYSVDGDTWQQRPMTLDLNGRYAATIEGQEAGRVLQFYAESVDASGQRTMYPLAGSDSRALLQVDDGRGTREQLAPFRMIMLQQDVTHLHRSTNSLSNQRLGATVVSGDDVYYNVGVRLKGSFVGRDAVRVGFNISFPPDQLFRGVHDKVAVDRSTHANLGIDEIILKHSANRAGDIPSMYDDLIDFVAPRSVNTGIASLRMAGFDELFLDTQFQNGSDGTVFEYEVLRWATTTVDGNPESIKRAGGLDAPNGYANIEIHDLGDNKEAYRWTNLIINNRVRDDYDAIIAMGKAFSQRGEGLYHATREVLDIDQWMRTAAHQSLFQPGDAYFTGSNLHNFRLYARPDGKVLYMPWDWDSAFQGAVNAPLIGGSRLGQIVRFAPNRRLFYGHMLDVVDRAFNEQYLGQWISHYEEVSGQRLAQRTDYVKRRSEFVTARIQQEFPAFDFEVTTPSQSVDADSLVVEGRGWVNVRQIRLAETGQVLDVTWSGTQTADQWQVTLPLIFGARRYTLEAVDYRNNVIAQHSLDVESTLETRPLNQFLRLTEVFYHPADDGRTEFLEFANVSDGPLATSIDLSSVTIQAGPSTPFVFPAGTVLAAGQHLVVVQDRARFQQAFPQVDAALIAGEYSGSLSNGGERLWVTDSLGGTLIDLVYGDSAPWPTSADGQGDALVLVNPAQTSFEQTSQPSAWQAAVPTPGSATVDSDLPGDLNRDQRLDAQDLDLLWAQLRLSDRDLAFDLNGDRTVDQLDWNRLVVDLLQAQYGDANLDGRFDSSDFVRVFQSGEYEDAIRGNSTWEEGDWNGDGDFTSADLVLALQSGVYVANARNA
jgi:hypothetical protein